jgi:hypothetical protein
MNADLLVLHSQVLKQERINIARLLDRLRRIARAVRGVRVDANENRVWTTLPSPATPPVL